MFEKVARWKCLFNWCFAAHLEFLLLCLNKSHKETYNSALFTFHLQKDIHIVCFIHIFWRRASYIWLSVSFGYECISSHNYIILPAFANSDLAWSYINVLCLILRVFSEHHFWCFRLSLIEDLSTTTENESLPLSL